MKEIIEEILSQAFEQFCIEGNGREGDIAEIIASDLKLCEPSFVNCPEPKREISRLEIISILKNLKNCQQCNGVGYIDHIEHGSYLNCPLCKGTGKDI